MKNNIFKLMVLFASVLLVLNSCQSPEDLIPPVARDGINSVTASFLGDESSENSFVSEIDHENGVITLVFPYNYPSKSENVLTLTELNNMRVSANLDDNVTVSPALLYLDFTKENFITVTNQLKVKKKYKIVADIRKSSEAKIINYELKEVGLTGIIDEEKKTISITSIESLGELLAEVSISHGATLDPDPRTVPQNYDTDFKITVIAQNGTAKSTYTIVKEVPEKVDLGMRTGSAKVLWAKKLQADLGISVLEVTGGLAVTNDYVVLNTRNQASIYLDKKTGQKIGSMPNMGSVLGNLTNFYSTADNGDNILVCNLAPNAGTFKVWKIKGVNGTPEVFIDWAGSGTTAIGRKLSVKGSIDGDAIVTAVILGADNKFARWQVKGGVLASHQPEIIQIKGLGGPWNNNADVVYSDESDLTSDYFVSYYALPRKFAWVNGKTNTVKAWGPEISGNWIQNATDHTMFNGASYAANISINSFTWGSDDVVYLHDASDPAMFTAPVWKAPIGTYGGKDNGGVNGNGTGDVVLKVSQDGYYMYLYFMFTNGQVVCVQYDCIKR